MAQLAAGKTTAVAPESGVTFWRLLAFFIPLGISASLVTISHLIINSTLTRSAQPELIISGYAIAMSLMSITERPAILLRQTCSALVRDRISFRAMFLVAMAVFISIIAAGLTISYLPPGRWVFSHVFGAKADRLDSILSVYRILMFVSIFSGIRCVFHGIIIYNRRTLWLTIGMIVRLVAMYGLSQFFILTNRVTSSKVGAILFLTGMVIEATVSAWEGTHLLRHRLPRKLEGHPVERPMEIFRFYRPLLYSSFIAVVIGPAINAVLGKTADMETSIAAFAIASSVMNLVQSFFSYIHQIVLNFYRYDKKRVWRFVTLISLIPTLLIGLFGYTPVGPWFLRVVIGADARLLTESLHTLRIFMILTLAFPWLDYANGLTMLRGRTRMMVYSQAANVGVTLITLFACLFTAPGWNGIVGSLAQSLGTVAELTAITIALRLTASQESWSF